MQFILESMIGKSVTSISFERQSLWHQKQQLKLMMSVCKLIHTPLSETQLDSYEWIE